MIKFYEYPKCTTCKKAKQWLTEHQIEFEAIDMVAKVPSKSTLKKIIKSSGLEFKKFFNTSGMKYRELGLKDKLPTLSDAEKLELLASDGMLIKRPMVITEDHVLLGFKQAQYDEVFNAQAKFEADLLFSKDHGWLKQMDNRYRYGVTQYQVDTLGSIVFVELPEVGQKVTANEPFANVESVKTVSELYAPIDGVITAVNEALETTPSLISSSPYEAGWVVEITPTSEQEVEQLLDVTDYKDLTSGL